MAQCYKRKGDKMGKNMDKYMHEHDIDPQEWQIHKKSSKRGSSKSETVSDF